MFNSPSKVSAPPTLIRRVPLGASSVTSKLALLAMDRDPTVRVWPAKPAKVPPLLIVTAPAIEPAPSRVAPLSTVTAPPSEPFTRSSPPPTVNRPL